MLMWSSDEAALCPSTVIKFGGCLTGLRNSQTEVGNRSKNL